MKKRTEVATAAPLLSGGLRRYLYVTVATTGASILVVEILGAKMLAPYVGTSHFVWTAQIAVTLLALACGYAAGGWLADRTQQLRWVYGAISLAALWLGGATLVCEAIAFAFMPYRLAVGSLLTALVLFFVPLALLAMVGPFFARVVTTSVSTVGANVGRLTAVGTLGSVAGVLLIGYALIPSLPNSTTMLGTASVLLGLSAVYFLGWDRRHLKPALSSVTCGALLILVARGQQPFAAIPSGRELFRSNSNFGMLQVIEMEGGGRRYYLNDLLNQNGYDPGERQSASLFTHLLHGLAHAYTAQVRTALCIGMGVGIVPMQLAAEGAQVEVVEINPAVVPVAQRYFDFDPARVTLRIGDGRYDLHRDTNRFDVIVLDAFLGESPPSHLMTREAFAAMRARLAPEGTLVMNTFGEFTPGRDFSLASLNRTLREVFASVRIHSSGNGNIFFVASDRSPLTAFREPDFARIPFELRGGAEAAWRGVFEVPLEHGQVLRDDFNPVDVRDAANREDFRRRLAMSYRPRSP